jgi:hypothetical protein
MAGAAKTDHDPPSAVSTFIDRWSGRDGGQERANYALFLSELCDVLGVSRPDPAGDPATNDYVFERVVQESGRDGSVSSRRIDLYKRGCFVLEAKQSRQKGGKKELAGQLDLLEAPDAARGRRGADRAWDVLMLNARRQAEDYVRLLPAAHPAPPFVIVCDVGHCLELYANFRGDGRAYDQYPDRQGFRVYLDDLRDPDIRARLALLFDPVRVQELDPTRRSAKVTRGIAERLAAVSKALEKAKHPPEDVAAFLARALFTMFAEDVGLLPEKSFRDVLAKCEAAPEKLSHMVGQLWEAMDGGGFAFAIEAHVKKFNGEFFKDRRVLPLGREEIGELRAAADANWREVEPAIFGTLLEQALDPGERKKLGAHYTPRPYVERLVAATIIDPLRADWSNVLATAERQKAEGRAKDAAATVQTFHDRLCATRVLDPACGTGNFLYVALELMKRLEGEVLEALADLGGQEALAGLEGHTVDPRRFLGLELNPRAAAIAELVLWIGYLQWHGRTKGGMPEPPILKAYHNIKVMDAVLAADKVLKRNESGKPVSRMAPDGTAWELHDFKNPRRPDWPPAEFIVGNPPFIGGKDIRARTEPGYVEALWSAHPHMNDSADFVMYWWDRAATILLRKGTILRRFGFVTTNSISQVFQRRVMERYLNAKAPLSLVFAIPDHPWTKAAPDAAAVRIAMTVAEAGKKDGVLREVVRESGLDTDTPTIELTEALGAINPDLTVGVDVTAAVPLKANEGLCSPGVKLHGDGFIVTPAEAEYLGLGRREGLERHIRLYRNGRDLTARPRGVMVIDLFGLTAEEVRERFPEVYQHVRLEVKEKVKVDKDGKKHFVGRDWNNRDTYKEQWWLFGEPRRELRPALAGLPRYLATVETTKHRVFQFLDAAILPDNMLVAVATDDAFHLGVLSSRLHVVWALRAGAWLGMGNDPRYSKSRCFNPFPFPDASDARKDAIRAIAEALDAHRKRVLDLHPHLTLTGLYNVLERLRAGTAPDALDDDDRRVFDDGLVLILKEHHDALDGEVAAAYGWPAALSDEDILARLVALNRERAEEEKRGLVRWLRPDYQIAKFGSPKERAELALAGADASQVADAEAGQKPAFPTDDMAQTAMVMAALANASKPLDAGAIAAGFRQGQRIAGKVAAVLAALTRMGVISTGDRGKTFALRRAA